MKKTITLMVSLLVGVCSFGQVVINELDSNTPGVDVDEFIELKTPQPYTALDNYVVVFFNGSSYGNGRSYFKVDLTGDTTDINGLLLIGSTGVSPVPDHLIPANVIQNGTDAVGIYEGDAADFPFHTQATTDNLVDALVYGSDSDNILLDLLGQTDIIDENAHGQATTQSIQRKTDGSYKVADPTPGQNNDGSGVVITGIDVTIPQDKYFEGDTMHIHFSTTRKVEADLTFSFTLNNDDFGPSDFDGSTTVTIPEGDSLAVATIHILDDGINDGDENLLFQFGEIPPEYKRIKDFLQVRVVDVNFTTADYGTPLNPTYDVVESTAPSGYYNSLDGLAGDSLRHAIQAIISNPDVVRVQTYADVIDILKQADQNPANDNQVWLIYTEQGRSKLDYQLSASSVGKWNREHTFPRSRGGFYARPGDDVADGKDVYWITGPDSTRQGFSEAHALRAVDGPENSSRGNQNYGPEEYHGPAGNAGSFYGDVARSVLYLAVRFNGLHVVDGYPPADNVGYIGDLATLLSWNQMDPPDDFEMHRNNVIYTWQFNRNPFIDYPELIEYLWGDHAGEVWHQPDMAVKAHQKNRVKIFPNPAQNQLFINGIGHTAKLRIIDMNGRVLLSKHIKGKSSVVINSLDSGVYLVEIISKTKKLTKRLVVR